MRDGGDIVDEGRGTSRPASSLAATTVVAGEREQVDNDQIRHNNALAYSRSHEFGNCLARELIRIDLAKRYSKPEVKRIGKWLVRYVVSMNGTIVK